MGVWHNISLRIRALLDRSALNQELDDEVRDHLARETEANIERGMTREEAARQARLDFGGIQTAKEAVRDVRGDAIVESALQDARFGLRMLRRNAGFTAVAATALALGLGANTAMFSVINAVLLRPLPYADPERVVRIIDSNPGKGFPRFSSSPPNFLDWREQARSFTSMAALTGGQFTLTGSGTAQRLAAVFVTPDLFSVLGVQAVLGRTFTALEGTYGHDRSAVLSYRLWQQNFGGDRKVLGQTIRLDGDSYVIVGVAPPEFRLNNNDIVVPLAFGPKVANQRGAHYLAVYARLKHGVTLPQANEEIKTIAARLAAAYPDKDAGWTAFLVPIQDYVVGRVRPALLMLFGAVGFLALIACANVANLLLARSLVRQREISVRAALGATRLRLVRQLLAESFVLCVLGAALGLAVALICIAALKKIGPADIPRLASVQLDPWVLAFAAGLTLLSTMVFGMLPAVRASRVEFSAALKAAAKGASGGRDSARLRSLLVFGEFALSLMLLIGAGLLIRSFIKLSFTDPGLDASHVLTFNLSLPEKKYSTAEQVRGFYDQLLNQLRALPGVTSAGAVNVLPASGDQISSSFAIRGAPAPPQDEPSAELRVISRDYFHTLGIPLLRGRMFDAGDQSPALIISDSMARKFWPKGDALGHFITMGVRPGIAKTAVEGEVIGIVGDVRDFGFDVEPVPTVYAPMDRPGSSYMNVVLRTAGDPADLARAARAAVAAADPDLPVGDLAPMDAVLAASLAQRRFYMLLLSIFSAVALLLSSTGLYGVISYSVSQRTQEIGIRMALGAKPSQLLAMVLTQGLRLSGAGLVAGILGALALNHILKGMLVGVSTTDALVFACGAATAAAVALLACLVPARRAMRLDPVAALRQE